MPATPAWLAVAEAVLNRGIRSSQRAETLVHRLNATALRVEIQGMLTIDVEVSEGTLMLVVPTLTGASDAPDEQDSRGASDTSGRPATPRGSRAPDATIAGSAAALLRLSRGSAVPGKSSDPGRPTVHGDAAIASLYQQLISAARPDLEEELSHLVGDLAARRLSLLAARAAAWARGVRRTARGNIAEYLQEESRDLVNRTELEEFLHGVDLMRETADRIEARLALLEHRAKGST